MIFKSGLRSAKTAPLFVAHYQAIPAGQDVHGVLASDNVPAP
jgi:hypothetical protein